MTLKRKFFPKIQYFDRESTYFYETQIQDLTKAAAINVLRRQIDKLRQSCLNAVEATHYLSQLY